MPSPAEPNPTELTQSPKARTYVVKRPLSAVLLSVAAHGGVLALVVMLRTAARTSMVETTSVQVLAKLEVAGGPRTSGLYDP